jgi:hypothetical protein
VSDVPDYATLQIAHRNSGDDRTTRMAAVMLGWSAVENFFPYFDV